MPAFFNHWLNQRLANGKANVERMGGKTDLYVQAFLTALPGALFSIWHNLSGSAFAAWQNRRLPEPAP